MEACLYRQAPAYYVNILNAHECMAPCFCMWASDQLYWLAPPQQEHEEWQDLNSCTAKGICVPYLQAIAQVLKALQLLIVSQT